MFKLWAKLYSNNHMIKDMVVSNDDTTMNRTRKIFAAIKDVCYEFNLSEPIWLDSSIREFKQRDRVAFNQDNFIDSIDFDYLEIHVIEEDDCY